MSLATILYSTDTWWARGDSNAGPLPCQGSKGPLASTAAIVSDSFQAPRNKPEVSHLAAIKTDKDSNISTRLREGEPGRHGVPRDAVTAKATKADETARSGDDPSRIGIPSADSTSEATT